MVTVKEVTTKNELRKFADYPNVLYSDNPYYIPHLYADDIEDWDPKKNPAFEHCMAKCFLASQGLQIDEEAPIPEYLSQWREAVRRLRLIYGAEHMVVKDYDLPVEEKLAKVQDILDNRKWTNPAFEPYIRGFVAEKKNQKMLYGLVDRLYEEQVRPENIGGKE